MIVKLFGHEKGSFTGAIGDSEGYFGIANKGTIFLDEVGELPLARKLDYFAYSKQVNISVLVARKSVRQMYVS